MSVQMRTTKIPDKELTTEVRHAREVDALKEQCNSCKLWKPKTPTKDCAIREKLVRQDSKVGWKKKHLFLEPNGKCKMYKGA